MNTQLINLQQTDSTSDYLGRLPDTGGIDDMTVVTADYQTAGRGQRGNKWEGERGKNLLFSMRVHPTMIPVARQFVLSMAQAIAVKAALDKYTDGITLKWPNDIYWHDKKLGGTIIDTSVGGGHIKQCIYGTGINVNQQEFSSDAPNPVSLYQITKHENDRMQLLKSILSHFDESWELLKDGAYGDISALYHSALYRAHGYYRFRDANGVFEAAIIEVEDDGHLVLHNHDGEIRRYMFKEVEFVQDSNNQ